MPYIDHHRSSEVHRNIIYRISKVIFFLCLLCLLAGCSTKYSRKADEYAQYEGEINQHTRLIQAESSIIFNMLTHSDAFNSICPKGTIVNFEPVSPYQVGTFVNTKINHIFKLRWRSQVMEIENYRKIRLRFLNGFFEGGTEIWEITPENTSTRITHTIIFQHHNFFKKLAWILKVRRKHNKMVEALLDNLKRIAEKE